MHFSTITSKTKIHKIRPCNDDDDDNSNPAFHEPNSTEVLVQWKQTMNEQLVIYFTCFQTTEGQTSLSTLNNCDVLLSCVSPFQTVFIALFGVIFFSNISHVHFTIIIILAFHIFIVISVISVDTLYVIHVIYESKKNVTAPQL